MRKGITPIISIIVLLLITIALAGVAWTYLQGQLLVRTEKAIEVPFGGIWCATDKMSVTVANVGTQPIVIAQDLSVATINGTAATPALGETSIPPKQAVIFEEDCGEPVPALGSNCVGTFEYRFVAGASVTAGTYSC